MGRIAYVVSFEANDSGGENIADVKIDIGGGEIVTAEHFASPGVDSQPLTGDYVATSSYDGGSEEAAVGYADPDNALVAGPGEVRLYSRDSLGNIVAAVYCKSDGSILVENENGAIGMAPDGTVNINGNFEVDP